MNNGNIAYVAPEWNAFPIGQLSARVGKPVVRYMTADQFMESGFQIRYSCIMIDLDVHGLGRPAEAGLALVDRIRITRGPNEKTPIVFMQASSSGPVPRDRLQDLDVNVVMGRNPNMDSLAQCIAELIRDCPLRPC